MTTGHTRIISRTPLLLQVLSLYLLLLAFFVLLNSISQVDETRLRDVKGSLNETFAVDGRPARETVRLSSSLGNIQDDAGFLDRISDLVRTEIALARVRVVTPGRLMEVSIPERVLFTGPDAAIDPLYRPSLENIAGIMTAPPPGVRYDADLLIGAQRGNAVAASRAAYLAVVFEGAGVPKRNIAAGIEYGAAGTVTMRFRVRSIADGGVPIGGGRQ